MKDIILKKSGIGLLSVLVLSLLIGFYYTGKVKVILEQFVPVIQQEAAGFLPITVQGGEIVSPKDTVIAKDYDQGSSKIVLNTKVTEFEPSSLDKPGVYVSKKYVYTYNGQKIEIQSLASFPDMVIDEDAVNTFVQYIQKYSGKFIFLTFFIGTAIGIGIVVLISTVLIHWLMAILFHVGFGYTLRINTLTYVILAALSVFAGVSFSILISFVIMIAANVAINTIEK